MVSVSSRRLVSMSIVDWTVEVSAGVQLQPRYEELGVVVAASIPTLGMLQYATYKLTSRAFFNGFDSCSSIRSRASPIFTSAALVCDFDFTSLHA